MNLQELIENARSKVASDIHLSCGQTPILRMNGDLKTIKVPPLTKEDIINVIYPSLTEEQKKEFEKEHDLDFAINLDSNTRVRVNLYMDINGPAVAMRLIDNKIKTLQDIEAPAVLNNIANLNRGLVLVTGPTGSGKSTTVASLIHYINKTHKKHIITVEDPIEFVHKSDKCLINQREIGHHCKSFPRALKSALREDPDIILVGEMRDIETISLALTAAETGHLVIGTLHTSSAPQTVDRIIDVFPSEDKAMIRVMFSNAIEAIISQQLLRRADGNGRIAAYEVLLANSGIRNLIREGKTQQIFSMMQVGTNHGMMLMKDSVNALFKDNIISKETAIEALNIVEEIGPQNKNNKAVNSSADF